MPLPSAPLITGWKIHSGGGGTGKRHAVDFAGVFARFSQRHKQIHYSTRNFLLVGPINESDFLSSQLSGGEQVGLLKSHRGFAQ